MPSPAGVEAATAEDAAEIAALYIASLNTALPWAARPYADAAIAEWVATRLLPGGETQLVRRQGVILAFMALHGESVEQLHVRPGHLRFGLGGGLLRHAQASRPALHLYTFQRNLAARAFYERHGFVVTSRSDGARNEEREPDLRYDWRALKTAHMPIAAP